MDFATSAVYSVGTVWQHFGFVTAKPARDFAIRSLVTIWLVQRIPIHIAQFVSYLCVFRVGCKIVKEFQDLIVIILDCHSGDSDQSVSVLVILA
jgi:hypothetical protein